MRLCQFCMTQWQVDKKHLFENVLINTFAKLNASEFFCTIYIVLIVATSNIQLHIIVLSISIITEI